MRRLRKITKVLRCPRTGKMTGVDETIFEDGDLVAKSSTGIYYALPPIVSLVEKAEPDGRERTPAEELQDAIDCYAKPDLIEELRRKVSQTKLEDLNNE